MPQFESLLSILMHNK